MGSVYDARKELSGWDTPEYADAGWRPVTADSGVEANLEAHPGAPIWREAELAGR